MQPACLRSKPFHNLLSIIIQAFIPQPEQKCQQATTVNSCSTAQVLSDCTYSSCSKGTAGSTSRRELTKEKTRVMYSVSVSKSQNPLWAASQHWRTKRETTLGAELRGMRQGNAPVQPTAVGRNVLFVLLGFPLTGINRRSPVFKNAAALHTS